MYIIFTNILQSHRDVNMHEGSYHVYLVICIIAKMII